MRTSSSNRSQLSNLAIDAAHFDTLGMYVELSNIKGNIKLATIYNGYAQRRMEDGGNQRQRRRQASHM
jgi:hypothetical protein